MHIDQNRRVITLSNPAAFEKRETPGTSNTHGNRGTSASFLETLFGLLGEKRPLVISYITMKLDCRRRGLFKADLGNCRSFSDECRCLKSYMMHLTARDLNTLLAWIRRLLTETIEGVAFPGENDPDRRLDKFARTFGFDRSKVDDCMLFLLLA